jgi:hypothetical protein
MALALVIQYVRARAYIFISNHAVDYCRNQKCTTIAALVREFGNGGRNEYHDRISNSLPPLWYDGSIRLPLWQIQKLLLSISVLFLSQVKHRLHSFIQRN